MLSVCFILLLQLGLRNQNQLIASFFKNIEAKTRDETEIYLSQVFFTTFALWKNEVLFSPFKVSKINDSDRQAYWLYCGADIEDSWNFMYSAEHIA